MLILWNAPNMICLLNIFLAMAPKNKTSAMTIKSTEHKGQEEFQNSVEFKEKRNHAKLKRRTAI